MKKGNTRVATMHLTQAGSTKLLAGHLDEPIAGETVFVLRKESREALRSILAADQAEAGERVAAILETVKPKPTRRTRKANP